MTISYKCSNCGSLLETSNANPLINQTIERCAQVAENYPFTTAWVDFRREIAAAIRALKDKP